MDAMSSNLIPTLVGALCAGLSWLFKAMYTARRELDIAYEKIRHLEDRLYAAEETIYWED